MSKARDSVEDLKTLDANLAAKLPKAGGTMTGDTLHGDNVKAKFGTGNDLEIYHDGSNSYVRDIGTGNLLITTDGGEIRMLTNNVNEFGLRIVQDDYVGLYHNNAAKLHTTSTGIDVTGNVDLPDNGKLLLGAGDDLQIYHDGTNSHIADNGTGNLILNGNEVRILSDDTSEYSGRFITNGAVELYYDSAKKLSTTATGVNVTGTLSTGKALLNDNGNSTIAGLQLGNQGIGLSVPTTDTLHLLTADQTRMTISSTGNVGVGVVPAAWNSGFTALQVGANAAIYNEYSVATGYVQNAYKKLGADWAYTSTNEASWYEQYNGTHLFKVAASGTAQAAISWNNAMTIKNDGQWTIGAFSASGGTKGVEYDNTSLNISAATTSEQNVLRFFNPNVEVGSIKISGSSTSYNTSSDYRLKTDVQPMTGATATFMQLKPCNFEWIADGTRVDGFLAHELGEVIPAAATGSKDAMKDEEYKVSPATGDVYTAGSDAGFNEVSSAIEASPAYYDVDGNVIKAEVVAVAAVHEDFDSVDEVIHSSDVEQPETLEDGQQWRETTAQVMATRSVPDMQGIDQAKVVPLLVATIQELIARVEALEVVG